MIGVLLHSGNLQDYTALGDEGQPIHAVATQIREVIRLRVSAAAAQSLAIPRINEGRSTVDWYASESGTVVPWAAASEIERAYALECLERYKEEVTTGLTALSGVSERERQVIQNLKDKIFTHPANNCVFLVNGYPVLTFWGFYAGQAPPADPFMDLRAAPATAAAVAAPAVQAAPVGAAASAPVVRQRRPWWLWLLLLLLLLLLLFWLLRSCSPHTAPVVPGAMTPPVLPVDEPKPTDQLDLDEPKDVNRIERAPRAVVPRDSVTVERDRLSGDAIVERSDRLIDRLDDPDAPAAEIPLAVQPFEDSVEHVDRVENADLIDQTLLPDGSEVTADTVVVEPDTPLAPDLLPDSQTNEAQVPGVDAREDEARGSQDAAPAVVPPEITVDPSEATTPPQAQTDPSPASESPGVGPRLAIPSDATRSGSISFTDGRWRAAGGLQDSATGKPVQLWYEFKDGQGSVTVDKGGGVRCQTSATSQMQGDSLMIAPLPAVAPCADGTALELPTIECKPDGSGPANCQGIAADGSPLPIIIRQSP